ncbi:ATPase [Mariniphaga sediminis]|uniref:ATPase n=1 Tax=Mariniphaga sediminis TaxID=1628158 RepID=A0A399D2L9_9BACT|nr:ATPase [Mariniphaga sediminis]RIH64931.1 ATPase [Mariniphaga sediminis]
MIAIADSGSSKTDWLFIEKEQETSIKTPGINPFFQNTEEILENQMNLIAYHLKNKTQKVFFYGAGCIKGKSDSVVAKALRKIFSHADIFVEDDMQGAARALLGKKEGIACILGTGANSCYYDGTKILDKVPPLGFILGDEGSGAHIGRLFLNDYFKRALPEDLKAKANKELSLDMPEVLAAVYRKEYPSRYLAGFSTFLGNHKNLSYTQNLIKRSFTEFFSRNIERYENYKNREVSFVGSIAFHYASILKEVAVNRKITIGKIIEKPIAGLKQYHTNT